MNDEQQLLASAYLDGAVTSDERARAEADPEVMDAVARLGLIRPALAGVEPPDPGRRDAAIDAALEVFDAEHQRATPPPVTSLAARRSARWLMPAAAAAAVVIIAGGIVATRGDDGDDDDSAGSAATTFEIGAAFDVADESAAQTAPAEPDETDAAGEEQESAAATTEVSGTDAAGTLAAAATAPTAAADGAVLTSPEDLTEFASSELFRVDAAPRAAARRLCDQIQGQWLGPATYVLAGVETPVEIFLVAAADEVRAVDTATCSVVATAPAPDR